MQKKIKDIIEALEMLAPPAYQEGYDNSGLIVGDKNIEISGVLISLDCTEAVVEEAIQRNCNLIVAHHPIVFKGLKSFTGRNYVERTVLMAIKNDIAIYAIHTNLDHVQTGVNAKISEKLGLTNTRILSPKKNILLKLTTFAPLENRNQVLNALFSAGAGRIGNYSECSFTSPGIGSFLPNDKASPVIGTRGIVEEVEETRIEVILPVHLEHKVLEALRKSHPYEEVAYYCQALENENQEVGAGMIGELETPLSGFEFLAYLKSKMELSLIRHTAVLDKPIRKVAVCGGAGSFLLSNAIRQQADVFVTADYKYHEFFDAENHLMICDIGHYESEVFTKDLLYDYLSGKFSNFALCLSDINTNPVSYYA